MVSGRQKRLTRADFGQPKNGLVRQPGLRLFVPDHEMDDPIRCRNEESVEVFA